MPDEAVPARPPKLLDVEALAFHYSVSQGTIGRWASEDGWKRYGRRSRRLWNLYEAQESFTRRHGRADDPPEEQGAAQR